MREDWVACTLEDICNINLGQSPPSSTYNTNKLGLPFYQGKAEFGKKYPTPKVWCEYPQKKAIKDDILLSVRAPVGATNIANEDCGIGRGLAALRGPYNNFLLYYLKFSESKLNSLGTGTTFKAISGEQLKSFSFPTPSISEQRAIVKKIETLFSSLDAGIADLKKSQEQMKIYRQAVLKKAFEGKYKIIKVGDFFNFLGGGTPSKKEESFWNGNINWASIKDIKGDFLNSTQDFITEKGLENSSSNIAKKGEVILATRINPGRSIISNIKTAINQDLKVIKPKNNCDNHFIHYLFKSIEDKCLKASSGTTVLGISLPNLRDIQIPEILDLKQQQQIVKEIESRLSVCDAVEKQIKNSLDQAEALRQSILKKAFEGNLLTEEELKACKAEPDYEPASVLLERIKAEKEVYKPVKKISKKKVS